MLYIIFVTVYKQNFLLFQGIWVDCNSEYLYTPKPLFPDYYYDNLDAAGYLPPIVAVKFKLTDKSKDASRVQIYVCMSLEIFCSAFRFS